MQVNSDQNKIDSRFVRSIAWTGGVKWISQILRWVATIVVARLLTPEDYGLVGMAGIYLGLAQLINEFGLGVAIVSMRELTEEQVAQLNSCSVALGVIIFCFSCLMAFPLALFFGAPELRQVIGVMSIAFVIKAFETIPNSVLQKELRFKLLAMIEGCEALILSLSMMIFALLGLGYWTLVLGWIMSATVKSSLALAWKAHRFALPRIHTIKNTMTFSSSRLETPLAVG